MHCCCHLCTNTFSLSDSGYSTGLSTKGFNKGATHRLSLEGDVGDKSTELTLSKDQTDMSTEPSTVKGNNATYQLKQALKVSEVSNSRKRKHSCRGATSSKQPTRKKHKSKQTKIDENVCALCKHPFSNSQLLTCLGCDYCPRWFHRNCVPEATLNTLWKCPFAH